MNNGFQALGRQKSLFVLAVSGLLLHILLACSGTMQCNALFLLNGKMSAFQLLKKCLRFHPHRMKRFSTSYLSCWRRP